MLDRLTAKQFAALLAMVPARGPKWSARAAYAHEVLVVGRRPVDVAIEAGVSRQTVSRAAHHFLSLQNAKTKKERA